MSWLAVGGLAVTAIGGIAAADAQKDAVKGAANSQTQGQQLSIAEQQRQFDLTRQDMQPWMEAGTGALGQMQDLNSGDFSSFTESPDYAFARSQGLQGLDRSAAARGSLNTGGHSADVMGYASGLASQNYGNFYDRLAGMAGQGQNTAGALGQFGAQAAGNISNAYGNIGNARASSYLSQGNTNSQLGGLVSGIGSNLVNNWGGFGQNKAAPAAGGAFAYQGGGNTWGQMGPSNGKQWNFGGGY